MNVVRTGKINLINNLLLQEKCYDTAMVEATLRTLHRFLSWIPVGYVFETNITELLANNVSLKHGITGY